MASNITVDTLTKGSTTLNTDEIVDTNSSQVCKAWANYNGSTNSIRDSHNISSITDNGSGDFSLNFSTAMANANYSIVGTAMNEGTAQFMGIQISTLTTTSARMYTVRMDESDPEYGIDKSINCYQVFGD
jgi:hypothetical protein